MLIGKDITFSFGFSKGLGHSADPGVPVRGNSSKSRDFAKIVKITKLKKNFLIRSRQNVFFEILKPEGKEAVSS